MFQIDEISGTTNQRSSLPAANQPAIATEITLSSRRFHIEIIIWLLLLPGKPQLQPLNAQWVTLKAMRLHIIIFSKRMEYTDAYAPSPHTEESKLLFNQNVIFQAVKWRMNKEEGTKKTAEKQSENRTKKKSKTAIEIGTSAPWIVGFFCSSYFCGNSYPIESKSTIIVM